MRALSIMGQGTSSGRRPSSRGRPFQPNGQAPHPAADAHAHMRDGYRAWPGLGLAISYQVPCRLPTLSWGGSLRGRGGEWVESESGGRVRLDIMRRSAGAICFPTPAETSRVEPACPC